MLGATLPSRVKCEEYTRVDSRKSDFPEVFSRKMGLAGGKKSILSQERHRQSTLKKHQTLHQRPNGDPTRVDTPTRSPQLFLYFLTWHPELSQVPWVSSQNTQCDRKVVMPTVRFLPEVDSRSSLGTTLR